MTDWATVPPTEVLDFWFPQDGHWETPQTHMAFWSYRMRGGADDDIRARFEPLATAAAQGLMDHWVNTPRGRLALVIALDQFPRSIWRNDPSAFGQDIKSANLCLEAFDNGDWDALPNVWQKQFMLIAVGHAEGPDHAARTKRCIAMALQLVDQAPSVLSQFYLIGADQSLKAHENITRFGRHAHRNDVLGRISTPEEQEYIDAGVFPHNRDLPSDPDEFARELETIKARLAPFRDR